MKLWLVNWIPHILCHVGTDNPNRRSQKQTLTGDKTWVKEVNNKKLVVELAISG